MSGALVELVSKGVQDAYITDSKNGEFLFRTVYTKHRNFSQSPFKLDFLGPIQNYGSSTVILKNQGDFIDKVWLEGSNLHTSLLGSRFELYIGGQMIDSQTYDFMTEVWQIYMAETQTKSQMINNYISQTNKKFFPLHFFFCDNNMFLPLLAIQYHQVEIKCYWGPNVINGQNLDIYGNYIFLDTEDRETIVKNPINILVTQVQKNTSNSPTIDLSVFNHPIKSIYFGVPLNGDKSNNINWSFTSVSIVLNGTFLLENMSPTYFYTVQLYYGSKYGIIDYNVEYDTPYYTQYFTYNFCLDTCYKPSGSCNFSRLDSAKMLIQSPITLTRNSINKNIFDTGPSPSLFTVYAVNYNVLTIKNGLAGILFSN